MAAVVKNEHFFKNRGINKNAARHPDNKLIKDPLLSTPPRTKSKRTGGQLKWWETTIKADLEPISRPQIFVYGEMTG